MCSPPPRRLPLTERLRCSGSSPHDTIEADEGVSVDVYSISDAGIEKRPLMTSSCCSSSPMP